MTVSASFLAPPALLDFSLSWSGIVCDSETKRTYNKKEDEKALWPVVGEVLERNKFLAAELRNFGGLFGGPCLAAEF